MSVNMNSVVLISGAGRFSTLTNTTSTVAPFALVEPGTLHPGGRLCVLSGFRQQPASLCPRTPHALHLPLNLYLPFVPEECF